MRAFRGRSSRRPGAQKPMTSEEARQVLLLYRPDTADARDPEVAAALAQAARDPELQRWFDQHREFQGTLRQKFDALPVPEDLKDAILAGRKIVRPAFWWQQPAWLAAAAAIAIMIGLGALWLRPKQAERFSFYRARMVRVVLHEYQMDIVTNDLRRVRQYLAVKGAPADFPVPKSLAQLNITGGGRIPWRRDAASMVCFERADKQMLFLFVIDRGVINGEPEAPKATKIGALQTVSWTHGANSYVLAGPDDEEFLKYQSLITDY
jgi:uncharacterized membrane protein YbaN (DUF454 family)